MANATGSVLHEHGCEKQGKVGDIGTVRNFVWSGCSPGLCPESATLHHCVVLHRLSMGAAVCR